MIANILNSISSTVRKIGQENNQFKTAATQQNSSISKFIKDISKLFGSQSKQQSDINNALGDLQQTSSMTSGKVDQTNNLLQESISIQTNMLSELKTMSGALAGLLKSSEQSDGTFFDSMKKFAGGAALGAGLLGATNMMEGNVPGLFGSGNKDTSGGESLTVKQMVNLAKEAGFTNEQAVVMGAIGAAESSGKPIAHNPNAAAGDDSYGLWQINMLGKLGPERREQIGITNNEQLFDPKTNAKAAKIIFDQQGFDAWSVYKSGAYSQYMGTATSSLSEKDDSMAPAGTMVEKSPASSKVGVSEQQSALAGIRKKPLSPKLKAVLDRAAAAAGVEAVVYSGGQGAYGSGEPRTGSTRHDNGNAADLKLYKNGKKLVDTNPEDRAIMAKFVSAAVAAGATGVGAGHNYMGPDSIHVGFGKQATWGGAPWIQAAASGIYNNQDLSSEGSSYSGYGQSGAGNSGGGLFDSAASSFSNAVQGTPLASLTGLSGQIFGALNMMSSGLPALTGMLTSSSSSTPMSMMGTGTTNLVETIFNSAGAKNPYSPNKDDLVGKGSEETFTFNGQENPEGDDLISLLRQEKEPVAAKNIQTAAIQADVSRLSPAAAISNPVSPTPASNVSTNNPDNLRTGLPSLSSYSSSPSWYLQLAGRISNDETMKFKGGVFA